MKNEIIEIKPKDSKGIFDVKIISKNGPDLLFDETIPNKTIGEHSSVLDSEFIIINVNGVSTSWMRNNIEDIAEHISYLR